MSELIGQPDLESVRCEGGISCAICGIVRAVIQSNNILEAIACIYRHPIIHIETDTSTNLERQPRGRKINRQVTGKSVDVGPANTQATADIGCNCGTVADIELGISKQIRRRHITGYASGTTVRTTTISGIMITQLVRTPARM
jgi:hypothetical protein